jgi:hypothetical protein
VADRRAASTGGVELGGWQIKILAKRRGGTERCAMDRLGQEAVPCFGLTQTGKDGASGGQAGRVRLTCVNVCAGAARAGVRCWDTGSQNGNSG